MQTDPTPAMRDADVRQPPRITYEGVDRGHQYAALAMGRLRGMGLIPLGHDQELQDAFEAGTLAPMLVGLEHHGDGVRLDTVEKVAKELEAHGLLKRDAHTQTDVVGTLAGVLAMRIDDVRECLGVPGRSGLMAQTEAAPKGADVAARGPAGGDGAAAAAFFMDRGGASR